MKEKPKGFLPLLSSLPTFGGLLNDDGTLNLEKGKDAGHELAFISAYKVLADFVTGEDVNPTLVKWAGDKFLANADSSVNITTKDITEPNEHTANEKLAEVLKALVGRD